MKKMTKGAIVTGLGVALLLGGGGTLATWNMNQSANAGTIQTGNMGLTQQSGEWTSNLGDGDPILSADIGKHKIVPGEKMTYTQVIEVSAEGNLKAELSLSMGSLSGGLLDNLSLESFTVTPEGKNAAVIIGYNGKATVDPGKYTVSATIQFDATGTDAMNSNLDLSSIQYVLTQKAPTPTN